MTKVTIRRLGPDRKPLDEQPTVVVMDPKLSPRRLTQITLLELSTSGALVLFIAWVLLMGILLRVPN